MRYLRESDEKSIFEMSIARSYRDIEKYCYTIASTKWDADDLFQETLMKIYLTLKKRPDMVLTKRYIYLTAKHLWIDQQRRKKADMIDIHTISGEIENKDCNIDLRESLEQLADYLSIKQFVIVLLIDVFEFTAKETATLLNETESNIHTTLHRARKTLSYYSKVSQLITDDKNHGQPIHTNPINPTLFEVFLTAFRERNPRAIFEGYLSLVTHQVILKSIKKNGYTLCFQIQDPDGNIITISA
ncbi:RNA polymerase sigma factor [Bacillus litorisediminis]|uniref:RNA polymerase sigma factor n=1 Tax=Bacillus litorisediminis TaxID=2922713 RepID=UPI001FAFECEA|nr:RNA polymerase sigma factor [Bacillus litorisediminis]